MMKWDLKSNLQSWPIVAGLIVGALVFVARSVSNSGASKGAPASAAKTWSPGRAVTLRGPGPTVGLLVRESAHLDWSVELQDAPPGSPAGPFLNVDFAYASETRVDEVNPNGDVIRFTTLVTQEESSQRGADGTVTVEQDALAGALVGSQRTEPGWTHFLAKGTPSKEQSMALEALSGWIDDRSLYPTEPQKSGSTWEVDISHFVHESGGKRLFDAASGRAELSIAEIYESDGSLYAKLGISGSVAGEVRAPQSGYVTFVFHGTAVRSLARGITTEAEFEFTSTWLVKTEVAAAGKAATVVFTGKGHVSYDSSVIDPNAASELMRTSSATDNWRPAATKSGQSRALHPSPASSVHGGPFSWSEHAASRYRSKLVAPQH